MNLIIDVGNTRIKLAVFNEGQLLHNFVCDAEDFTNTLNLIHREYPGITHCILASVGKFSEANISLLQQHYTVIKLDHKTKVPFKNNYGTASTLGVDRIALVSAAAVEFPKKNVLVIDAGSCITYDLITANNTYLGGAISPGILMRYKAIHTFTANLPLLEPKLPIIQTGNSTESSIHSGILQAVVFEIEGFVRTYKEKYPDLTVILTGGDAHFLRDSLKSDIFANSNFLLEGLNFILEHNKH
ncbi:type III pantothenate kinase [Pukyongia salina]|uniref:Type III pantothenate kinase n=1 Tax=Pukyongia salina TaxID=2094025 RepID=A0A2S0HWQ3_9FLAO|nr:type III pantothenate kinase [Pukyongia salina]AVI51060.1 type III pantothenate kinase [Pukyongia salina]